MKRPPGYWYVAAIYACGYGSMSFFFPHVNQYLLGAGFSGVQVGNIFSLSGMIGLILGPALLLIADRTGSHRTSLLLVLLVEVVALAGFGLGTALIVLAASVVAYRVTLTLDLTLRDRLTLHWLSEQGSEAFGSLRLWGSLSYAILATAGGMVAIQTGVPILFVTGGLLVLLMIPLLRVFAAHLPTETDDATATTTQPVQSSTEPGSPRRIVQAILKPFRDISPAMIVVLMVTFTFALSQASFFGWTYDFVENTLGGGKFWVSLFSGWAALIEVPVMVYVDRLIGRSGTVMAWMVGILFWVAGCMLLSLVQTPAQALLMGTLTGLASGFILVAPVVMVGQVSKAHRMGLNLSLMATFSGLGFIVGSPLAGWLFDTQGVRLVLQSSAGLSLMAAVVLVIGWGIVNRRQRQPQPHPKTAQ